MVQEYTYQAHPGIAPLILIAMHKLSNAGNTSAQILDLMGVIQSKVAGYSSISPALWFEGGIIIFLLDILIL